MASMAAALDTTVELVTPENIAFRYQLAGPFRRLPALITDFVIKMAVIMLFAMGTFFLGLSLGGIASALGLAFILVFWFVLSWFYGVLFEAMFNGKTPGKWIWGIRVVSIDGHPISGIQAMIRNLLRVADLAPPVSLELIIPDWGLPLPIPTGLVGLAVMACNPRMQRLGDLAAGTMVIVDERAWTLPTVKVDDPRVPALASFIPADFRVTPTLSRALAQYAERRAYLSPARRREVARRLADPLLVRFEFRPDIDPDLLLYSLYWRIFLADSREGPGDLGAFAGSSPLLRDLHKTSGVEPIPASSLPLRKNTPDGTSQPTQPSETVEVEILEGEVLEEPTTTNASSLADSAREIPQTNSADASFKPQGDATP